MPRKVSFHTSKFRPFLKEMRLGRVHIFVSGFVQGIFFRAETKDRAEEFGLFGWVKNLSDGRVEILAEGEKEKLEKLVDWAKRGPAKARVNDIEVEWQEYKGEFSQFEIRYD